ncbi:MAG: hypothetical protein WBA15_03345 [Mesorhizobium sp.]
MESLIIQDVFQPYFDGRDASRPKPVHTKQSFCERGQNPIATPPQASEIAKNSHQGIVMASSKNDA